MLQTCPWDGYVHDILAAKNTDQKCHLHRRIAKIAFIETGLQVGAILELPKAENTVGLQYSVYTHCLYNTHTACIYYIMINIL